MAKVYYIGDWAVMCGPVFAETAFNYAYKGLELFNYGKWLKAALESSGDHEVNSVAAWDFYKLGPGEYEQVLHEYDVIVFSDVEAKNFQLAPSFFDREKFGKEILTFPDRVHLTTDAVRSGKGVMFLGGWLSFTGEMGKGGWNRTALRDVLPVQCLDFEDLIESTEGFTAETAPEGESFFKGVNFNTFPPILGYNKTIPRQDCSVLAAVTQTGDPLVAVGEFGAGKTLAYMSDPAPHWGCNFVFWDQYADFWLRCLEFVL
jgi:uncharacterized membrane protein